ncbi:unnamed protein product [Protopolystoma xenopodis]|uniref:Uncharacterized protein n=1 Tax=Protopolystoma xenopodis TaxID=117903 RepID=A0A3S5A1D9_9PLAT|nr:unnamed protein product [Protopolystoma xenopodis]
MMAPCTDYADYDAGKTLENVPSQYSNAQNHEYCGRGHGTRYVPQGLPETPTKLWKPGRTDNMLAKA